MKHLTKIILENFQSHKYSVIEFNQGLNVIVGPSDTGKSAIIRGLKWALYNEPAGDYFIREGEKDCSVTLEFSDKTKIKRYRSKSKNMYLIYDKDGNETKYEGFGTSVPEEIIERIGIKKIHLDSNESNAINLGEQLEGPFLLSEKPSTRASAIGRLIGVNIIDDALRDTLRDLRNSNLIKKNLDTQIESLKSELKNYDYLDDLSKDTEKLDTIYKLIKTKTIKLERLKKKTTEYANIKAELHNIYSYLTKLENLDKFEKILKDISVLYSSYKYYSKKRETISKVNKEINDSVKILNKLNDVNYVEEIYESLINSYNKKHYFINLYNKLSLNLKEANKLENLNDQLKGILKFEESILLAEKNINRLIKINDIKKKLDNNQRSIGIGILYIGKLENVDEILNIYNKLDIKIKSLYRYEKYFKLLTENYKQLNKENILIQETQNKINQQLEKYRALLRKIEVCPVCLSNIDGKKIEHIVEHYS